MTSLPIVKESSKEKQEKRQLEVKLMQQELTRDYNIGTVNKPINDNHIFGHYINKLATVENDLDNLDESLLNPKTKYLASNYNDIFSKEMLKTSRGTFCCYTSGNNNNNLVFVMLHGAGHTGLSWSLVSKVVSSSYDVLAFDYRGHGCTLVEESLEYKMSVDNLVDDIICIINTKYNKDNPPPIVLVGHSLGGALAIHTAYKIKSNHKLMTSLQGIVVIDVVEGTALSSLIHMRSILNKRPKSFDKIEDCIKYATTTGMIRNLKSAKISVPSMFIKDSNNKYVWRTKLILTQMYWKEWFKGISKLFLTVPLSKMLMLANTDRLDKELTIGQMQGKYELVIMGQGVGHTVHEDIPNKVGEKLLHFVKRNQFIKMWNLNKKIKLKHINNS